MSELTLEYTPRPGQLQLHEAMAKHRFGVAVCHRRFGKTFCAVMALIYAALSEKRSDGRYAYIAPFYRQAKNVAWDVFKQNLVGFPVKFNEAELRVDFSNGSRISLFGGDNPDSLRGIYLDGVVIDEVGDMRPATWGEVVRPTLADRLGWAFFIGTPKGVNMFYDIYQEALRLENWFALTFKASETDVLPKEELEAARREMSESAYAREFECDFGAGRDDILIPAMLAMDAAKRSLTDREVRGAVKIIGVDVARYGDDATVLFPVQGLKAHEPVVMRKQDNIEVAQAVMGMAQKFDPDYVRIDAGRGEGVIDYLRRQRMNITEVNFGGRPRSAYYMNARAEMWDGMRKWLESGGCIPHDTKLITELSTPTYHMSANNKMVVESKESMRLRGVRSPDMADALALAVGVPLPKQEGIFGGGIQIKSTGSHLRTTSNFKLSKK